MITIPWWVIPASVALAGVFAFWVATRWRNRIDALVLGRVDAVLAAVLNGLQEREEAEAVPGLPAPVDPWASLQSLHDGLPEPAEPELPEHPWLRDPTGQMQALPVEALGVDKSAEAAEEKPDLRGRFNQEPKPPKKTNQTEVSVKVDYTVPPKKASVTG